MDAGKTQARGARGTSATQQQTAEPAADGKRIRDRLGAFLSGHAHSPVAEALGNRVFKDPAARKFVAEGLDRLGDKSRGPALAMLAGAWAHEQGLFEKLKQGRAPESIKHLAEKLGAHAGDPASLLALTAKLGSVSAATASVRGTEAGSEGPGKLAAGLVAFSYAFLDARMADAIKDVAVDLLSMPEATAESLKKNVFEAQVKSQHEARSKYASKPTGTSGTSGTSDAADAKRNAEAFAATQKARQLHGVTDPADIVSSVLKGFDAAIEASGLALAAMNPEAFKTQSEQLNYGEALSHWTELSEAKSAIRDLLGEVKNLPELQSIEAVAKKFMQDVPPASLRQLELSALKFDLTAKGGGKALGQALISAVTPRIEEEEAALQALKDKVRSGGELGAEELTKYQMHNSKLQGYLTATNEFLAFVGHSKGFTPSEETSLKTFIGQMCHEDGPRQLGLLLLNSVRARQAAPAEAKPLLERLEQGLAMRVSGLESMEARGPAEEMELVLLLKFGDTMQGFIGAAGHLDADELKALGELTQKVVDGAVPGPADLMRLHALECAHGAKSAEAVALMKDLVRDFSRIYAAHDDWRDGMREKLRNGESLSDSDYRSLKRFEVREQQISTFTSEVFPFLATLERLAPDDSKGLQWFVGRIEAKDGVQPSTWLSLRARMGLEGSAPENRSFANTLLQKLSEGINAGRVALDDGGVTVEQLATAMLSLLARTEPIDADARKVLGALADTLQKGNQLSPDDVAQWNVLAQRLSA